jgi:hypothetical protein
MVIYYIRSTLETIIPYTSFFPRFASLNPAPNILRDLNNQRQLLPLVLLRQRVSMNGARETTLAADSELLQRRVLGGSVDLLDDRLLGLELGNLGRDAADDDGSGPVFGEETKGSVVSGSGGLPLEVEDVDTEREGKGEGGERGGWRWEGDENMGKENQLGSNV